MEKGPVIAGKNLFIYDPHGGKKYTSEDIGRYLKRFQLHNALRLIGETSYRNLATNIPHQTIHGVPVSDSILAYVSMRLIEHSNDYRNHMMTLDDISKVCDMYFGLPDPIEIDRQAAACLIRSGATQFDYDREMRYLLPRMLLILRDLWATVPEARRVDIQKAVKDISGLTLEEIFAFAFAFSGKAKKGFFRIYEDNDLSHMQKSQIFQTEKQMKFIGWVSCRYSEFRDHANLELSNMPNPSYEKHRFNPLIKLPVISPDRNPQPGSSPVYILPIPRLLHERVSTGLYFELSDSFIGSGKQNPFRTAFGYVFQEYVGVLLKNSPGHGLVLSGFKYGKLQKDTTDWIVIKGETAVFVEVKQSGLYLKAKTWGHLEEVKRNLTQTIAYGVKQLWSFEQDVRSGQHKELEPLTHIKNIERIVVTYDRSYFANSLLRDLVKEGLSQPEFGVPEDFHWHTISIEELECLLSLDREDFFGLLNAKRVDYDGDAMDFRDYLARKYPGEVFSNRYLDKVSDEFTSGLVTELGGS